MRLAEKVYENLRRVPKGRVTTYKLLAQKVGTRAYRAVGQILARNPYAPEVPCHRVVASSGRLGGFMGGRSKDSLAKKVAMLKKEGVEVIDDKIKNFERVVFKFSG